MLADPIFMHEIAGANAEGWPCRWCRLVVQSRLRLLTDAKVANRAERITPEELSREKMTRQRVEICLIGARHAPSRRIIATVESLVDR